MRRYRTRRIRRSTHAVVSASINLNEKQVIQISPFRYLMRCNHNIAANHERADASRQHASNTFNRRIQHKRENSQ